MNRLEQIRNRMGEIRHLLESDDKSIDLNALDVELRSLNQEKVDIEKREAEKAGTVTSFGFLNSVPGQEQRSKEFEQRAELFENGKAVKLSLEESQIRSISIAGGNVALQTQASQQLQPVFNEVSSLVDLVHSFPIPGGESYNQGFVVSSGSADYSAEGADYHDNDEIETDFVNIVKAKITTYFELPEEVQKLGGNQYMTFAHQAALTAVRKKMSQQIIVGTGGTNSLLGIFNAPLNVMPATVDLTVTQIDNQTLDEIVFKHGGDESVEGGAYLILNKQTLAEFSKLRATTGQRLYTIKLDKNGNSGSISSEDSFEVPFIINSVIKSFDDAAVGEYFMAYGKPAAYEMPLFSGLEIQESKDFKFKSGQIAIKASVFAGGNTCCYKGFTRIKKG
ncbi:phage major capsid protein [Neobacillus sp. PS3-40]|uniref:phage major capsid protein n=1 Tax=Neobacillus sp. PS3-40 TaxID=3070679 RepID=UPI0027E024C4|nr:phage major capsid protein [Neobacillus sp. PS3-40]WML42705.1 phage major capsid protein [Neobacillus sp. PS3-40]